MMDFVAWDKIPRLFKDMVVTEKIDGTNAAVIIGEIDWMSADQKASYLERHPGDKTFSYPLDDSGERYYDARLVGDPDHLYLVGAQSRTRLITPEQDNFGFARWAFENAEDLVRLLGPGRHYGEWWGSGIQRGYGLPKGEKRFSLFLRHRYPLLESLERADGLKSTVGLVPLLAEGPFDLDDVRHILADLRKNGSKAAPGFMNPEGVVVWHAAARQTFKAFVEDDGKPKSLSKQVGGFLDSVTGGPGLLGEFFAEDRRDLAKSTNRPGDWIDLDAIRPPADGPTVQEVEAEIRRQGRAQGLLE